MAGLTAAARVLFETAEVLVGGERHLNMVPDTGAERVAWARPLHLTIDAIEARRGQRVAVLASGDPMWYSIGATLIRRFPREEMTVLPQPGSFSLAAARLGWPLADCATITLHGQPIDSLRLHLAPRRRILILSEDGDTPKVVAELLTRAGWGPSRLTVFAHLGGPREASITEEAQSWGDRGVPDLNTIALACRGAPDARALPQLSGLPDEVFEHDGQLTKREVRAATVAALGPLPGEMLWDIAAGCGSVAIEWMRAHEGRSAIAIERDTARAAMIARNSAALGVPALRIVVAPASKALDGLPPPSAVFIGGGIGDPGLLPQVWAMLPSGGRLAVSRAEPRGPHHLWRALAPVTQFCRREIGLRCGVSPV